MDDWVAPERLTEHPATRASSQDVNVRPHMGMIVIALIEELERIILEASWIVGYLSVRAVGCRWDLQMQIRDLV